jgi:hypothetical protein
MQFALIAPLSMQEYTKYGDMHFVVPGYSAMKFYRFLPKFKMLDNGAWEYGEAVKDEKLLYWAKMVRADEICLPDKLFDHEVTFDRTKEFLKKHPRKDSPYQYAMTPQAKNPMDWVRNYRYMCEAFPEVDTICVPKWLDKKFPGERLAVLQYLRDCGKCLDSRPHHLFGLGTLNELKNCNIENVRSVDSAKPITYGFHKILLPWGRSKSLRRVRRQEAYMHPMSEEQNTYIKLNIERFRRACRMTILGRDK